MCIPMGEYQYVNPSTQVALQSTCVSNCQPVQNISWKVYQGSANGTQWIPYSQLTTFQNIWFFGKSSWRCERYSTTITVPGGNTSHFTATKDIFIDSPNITYWRFEVVYTSGSQLSSSALNFMVNQPPHDGTCSVYPLSGTTTTLFSIACWNWLDDDEVKGYSFYGTVPTNSDCTIFRSRLYRMEHRSRRSSDACLFG